MREINTELNDKVALLARLVGVRHSLTGYCLLVARTVTTTTMFNKYAKHLVDC